MLYKYRFKNLWCFADEAKVSFMVGKGVPDVDSVFDTPRGVRLSKCMAVQGANGAGKSTILRALFFLSRFIGSSFSDDRDERLIISGHKLSGDEPSELEAEFEHENEHYRYRLVATSAGVVHESLHRKTGRSFRYLFRRDVKAAGDYRVRQQDFGFAGKEAARVRANASLISTAAQYNVPCARIVADHFRRVTSNNFVFYEQNRDIFDAAKFFHRYPKFHRKMVNFMRQMDLGLSDVVIDLVERESKNPNRESTMAIPVGIHRRGRKSFSLPFWEESDGTQSALIALQKILPALEFGGTVIMDELDSGLHPDMVMALLGLFIDPRSNPGQAQIIFTSYVPDVMDTLQKEQIMLVEKDGDGCSTTWRLGDIPKIRRDENYYGKYRAGAYGGIPDI